MEAQSNILFPTVRIVHIRKLDDLDTSKSILLVPLLAHQDVSARTLSSALHKTRTGGVVNFMMFQFRAGPASGGKEPSQGACVQRRHKANLFLGLWWKPT